MKLDLTPILNRRVPVIDFDFTVNADEVPDAPDISEEITLDGDIRVTGRVCDNDGYMSLTATVAVDYTTVCDRCLAPLEESIEFEFSRIVTLNASFAGDDGIDEDEILIVKEGGIDFDRDVIEELSLELPIYHLCDEDCPGLCSVCGKDLRGACTCKTEKEIDPRMETFKKLLENMNK